MRIQYRRMINYSVRRYQNQIISRVMQHEGPTGLPARLAQLYSAHLPSFTIRPSPALAWFDYQALRRIRRAAEFRPPAPPLRSEEHTSELQSLIRSSFAGFCLKKNTLVTSPPP